VPDGMSLVASAKGITRVNVLRSFYGFIGLGNSRDAVCDIVDVRK